MNTTRRLVAILSADVVGYSRLMGRDEAGTLERIKELRRDLIDPKITHHQGRIVKTTGDGILIEYPSVVEAVASAVAIQREMADRNVPIPEDQQIVFRVGINLGDIIVDGDDIHGDGVNVAARLETIAEPGGVCVSGIVYDQVRDKLDLAFDDQGDQQLKNIVRPVRAYRVQLAQVSSPTSALPMLALPDKPSLAVLPFQNMSGDPEQEYFVDGMVEDITTAIARLPWLFVIARNSSFAYKGKSPDLRQVGRELGVRYVLEGSVRKAGNRVRITGQLIDTTTGAHIWADRIDGALDDIFELQDQVASSVVGAIEPKLRLAEIERVSRKPTESLDAYDLYLRALAQLYKYSEDGMGETITLAGRALASDPSYAPAAGLIGWCRVTQRAQGWGAVSEAEVTEAVRLARQALDTGRDDPDVLYMVGATIGLLAGELSTALDTIDRALTLNPNSAMAWNARGFVLCFLNQPAPAIEAVQRAMRLSPFDPLAYFFASILALAHMSAGGYAEAIEWADRAYSAQPRYVIAIRIKLACLGHLGRTEEARDLLGRVLAVQPGLTIARWKASYNVTLFAPEFLVRYTDGLRMAGLSEE
jgi:adenylate cyclase